MKNILAFVGSAKHNGNISSIVEKILQGAREKGLEAKIYYLNDMQIKACQGVFSIEPVSLSKHLFRVLC